MRGTPASVPIVPAARGAGGRPAGRVQVQVQLQHVADAGLPVALLLCVGGGGRRCKNSAGDGAASGRQRPRGPAQRQAQEDAEWGEGSATQRPGPRVSAVIAQAPRWHLSPAAGKLLALALVLTALGLSGLSARDPKQPPQAGVHTCAHRHAMLTHACVRCQGLQEPPGGYRGPRLASPTAPIFRIRPQESWRGGVATTRLPTPRWENRVRRGLPRPERPASTAEEGWARRDGPTSGLLQLPQPPQRGLQGQAQLVAGAEQAQQVAGAPGAARAVHQLPGRGQPVRPELELLALSGEETRRDVPRKPEHSVSQTLCWGRPVSVLPPDFSWRCGWGRGLRAAVTRRPPRRAGGGGPRGPRPCWALECSLHPGPTVPAPRPAPGPAQGVWTERVCGLLFAPLYCLHAGARSSPGDENHDTQPGRRALPGGGAVSTRDTPQASGCVCTSWAMTCLVSVLKDKRLPGSPGLLGAKTPPPPAPTPSDTHQKGQLPDVVPGEVVEQLWSVVHLLRDSRAACTGPARGKQQGQPPWGRGGGVKEKEEGGGEGQAGEEGERRGRGRRRRKKRRAPAGHLIDLHSSEGQSQDNGRSVLLLILRGHRRWQGLEPRAWGCGPPRRPSLVDQGCLRAEVGSLGLLPFPL